MAERTDTNGFVPEFNGSAHKMAFIHTQIVPHAVLFAMEPGEELTKGQIMARTAGFLGEKFSSATFTRSYFELQIAQFVEAEGDKLRLTALAVEAREAYLGLADKIAGPFKARVISRVEEITGTVPDEIKVRPADYSIFTREYLKDVFETFWDERRLALLASLVSAGETNRSDLSKDLGISYTSIIGMIKDMERLGFADVDRRTIRVTELGTMALQAFKDYAQRLQKPFLVEFLRRDEKGFNLEPGTLTSIVS